MKIKQSENSIELKPSTKFEKEALAELRSRTIKKIRWSDDWNRSGKLIVEFVDKDDWDT